MPITSTIQQGTLSLAAATPGNSAIGDAAAAGTSSSVARADHKHGREASGTAGASAVGDTASAGSATTVALSDHRHSREAFGTPVNIDASVTSLSAGSLTTVARADHIHTVSKVPVLIASTTLGTTASSITLSSISQQYQHLMLIGSFSVNSSAYAGFYWGFQYNGDTGTNYHGYGGNSMSRTYNGLANGTGTYGEAFAAQRVMIFDYTSTSKRKWSYSESVWNNSLSTWATTATILYSIWNSTAAITSINIADVSGNSFVSGTKVQLYGIP